MAARERTNRNTDATRVMANEVNDTAPTGGSDMNVAQTNIAEEGQEMIAEGRVYKEKNGTLEVVPFFVDFARATVRFAPLGRATEDEMRTSDFLGRFELVEKSVLAEATPEESQRNAEARMRAVDRTDKEA
jgi:hypothetical protein